MQQLGLFDDDPGPDPLTCSHEEERETFTVWPGFIGERLTWTCERCGFIRGRCTVGKRATRRVWNGKEEDRDFGVPASGPKKQK